MAETTTEAIAGNQHFVWVSEVDGEVVGAVGAMSERSFWYERQQCSVMLYYTRKPGEGVKLLREFSRWVKSRPVIKIVVIELEPRDRSQDAKAPGEAGLWSQIYELHLR